MRYASIIVAVIGFGISSPGIAQEQPKAGFLARASCTVVRYYAAKYTAPTAEAWARSKRRDRS
jgi:hypothetical protein